MRRRHHHERTCAGAKGNQSVIQWSEQHQMMRDMVRRFIEAEIVPHIEELEHGDLPPYDILRKMFQAFGIEEVAKERFRKQIERDRRIASGELTAEQAEQRNVIGPEAA